MAWFGKDLFTKGITMWNPWDTSTLAPGNYSIEIEQEVGGSAPRMCPGKPEQEPGRLLIYFFQEGCVFQE